MKEIEFKNWLQSKKVAKKIQSDHISRLKRLENELGIQDIDYEFAKDECKTLLSCFFNKGENSFMAQFGKNELPVGKYSLATYKYSLKIYLSFLKDQ